MGPLHRLRGDAVPAALLHDDEREHDHIDVERRRLDLQAPLALPAEEALADRLLRETRDLRACVETAKLQRRLGFNTGL